MNALLLNYTGCIVHGKDLWTTRSKRMAAALGVHWSPDFEDYFKLHVIPCIKGQLSTKELVDKLVTTIGKGDVDGALTRYVESEALARSTVPNELTGLKQKFGSSLPITLMTNYSREWVMKVLDQHNIKRHFKKILSSDSDNLWLPLPSAFERAANDMNVSKQSITFVSDNNQELNTAKRLGMKTVFIKGQDQEAQGHPTIKSLSEITRYI